MKRFIDETLKVWKNRKRRKPLIVRGARQVGKTYSIQKFGKDEFYNDILTVNFEKKPSLISVFDNDIEVKKIISELGFIFNHRIIPGKTLLFFDEIQNCPRALLALRYFYEELPELHVIAAGSLIEFALSNISFPVGRVQFCEMFPLTFPEYLMGINRDDLIELILSPPEILPDSIHSLLLKELEYFFIIGGMPEAVNVYIDTSEIIESREVQSEICNTYRQDFSRYAPHSDKRCLEQVFNATARNVGAQIKYSRLTDAYSNPTIKKAFELLLKARVITRVSSCKHVGIPLSASINGRIFKSIMVDMGLMHELSGLHSQINVSNLNLMAIYQGALAEQFVGQEILAAAGSNELYYWSRDSRNSSAEIDFIQSTDNSSIIPIEVKRGPSGRLKSMHLFGSSRISVKERIFL